MGVEVSRLPLPLLKVIRVAITVKMSHQFNIPSQWRELMSSFLNNLPHLYSAIDLFRGVNVRADQTRARLAKTLANRKMNRVEELLKPPATSPVSNVEERDILLEIVQLCWDLCILADDSYLCVALPLGVFASGIQLRYFPHAHLVETANMPPFVNDSNEFQSLKVFDNLMFLLRFLDTHFVDVSPYERNCMVLFHLFNRRCLMTNARQQLKQYLQNAILARGENLWLLKYARLISLPLDDQQSLPIITGLIMLLKTGSDANVKDENGNTTAHILAQNYRTPEQKFTYVFCLDQLHQAGAIFNQANNDGVRVFYLKIGIDHPGYTDWWGIAAHLQSS